MTEEQNIDTSPSSDSTKTKKPTSDPKQERGISWKFILIIICILIPIRLFVAEPYLVYGSSMEPTFETGDYIIVDELTYKLEAPKRGDVIVLQPPYDLTRHFIKRIVGLPGETITVKGSVVTILTTDNQTITLNEPYVVHQSDKDSTYKLTDKQYFVMGDNREVSYDSRSWGPLPTSDITGKVLLRLYPFNEIGITPGKETAY